MKVSIYESFPNDARKIREAVFIDEQGFQSEYDEIDETATHFCPHIWMRKSIERKSV